MSLFLNAPKLYRKTYEVKHAIFRPKENSGCFLIRVLVDNKPYWVSLLALAVSNKYGPYFKNLWLSATTTELEHFFEVPATEKQNDGLCYNPIHLEEPEFAWLTAELQANPKLQDHDEDRDLSAIIDEKFKLLCSLTYLPTLSDNQPKMRNVSNFAGKKYGPWNIEGMPEMKLVKEKPSPQVLF